MKTDKALAPALERGRKMLLKLLKAEGGVIELDSANLMHKIAKSYAGRNLELKGWCWRDNELVIRLGHELIRPVWQFDAEVRPHMSKILKVFKSKRTNGLSILIFFVSGNMRLNGKSPIQSLRNGKVKEVLRAARSYLEHGAA